MAVRLTLNIKNYWVNYYINKGLLWTSSRNREIKCILWEHSVYQIMPSQTFFIITATLSTVVRSFEWSITKQIWTPTLTGKRTLHTSNEKLLVTDHKECWLSMFCCSNAMFILMTRVLFCAVLMSRRNYNTRKEQ